MNKEERTKAINKIISDINILRNDQTKTYNDYDDKIKSKVNSGAELAMEIVVPWLKSAYPQYQYEVGPDTGSGMVVIFHDEGKQAVLKFYTHLKIWQEMHHHKLDKFIRLCYLWDIESDFVEGGLSGLIAFLKKKIPMDLEIESKLYSNFNVVRNLLELEFMIKSIHPVIFRGLSYDRDFSCFILTIDLHEDDKELREQLIKEIYELDILKEIVLSFERY